MNNIYLYKDYKAYLRDMLDERFKRGGRSQLAEHLRCRASYVTQVLKGSADLSLEQAELTNGFLGHGPKEAFFFILLVECARAGIPSLKERLAEQIEKLVLDSQELKKRLHYEKTLSPKDQSQYYSSWHYAAIHTAVGISGLTNSTALAKYLGLSVATVQAALSFLQETGLVVESAGKLSRGNSQLYITGDAPMIALHHSNWRLKALQSMGASEKKALHYSAVATISRSDEQKLKEIFIQAVESARTMIRGSGDEVLVAYCADVFSLEPETGFRPKT